MREDRGRWHVSWPLFSIGATAVVAGGLTAAATAPSPSEHGSWAAAYLVLVVGAAQIALGAGQAALSTAGPSARTVWVEATCWNVANAAVIAGTIADLDVLVYLGGALLVATLAQFANAARRGTRSPTNQRLLYAFRAIVIVLIVSVPIGLVLAAVRGKR